MKKIWLVVVFLLIANFAFVIAADAPTVAVGEGDVEELQGIIDQLPFDESGETNYSQYKPFYTKAEERIDAINLWLDDNAGWMRYIFHMRPQVSLLFALNIYFILLFLLILILNGRGLWFFIESEKKALIFGVAVFIIFGAIGLYVGLAYVVNNFLVYVWTVLASTAVWMAIIAMVILVFLLIFLYPFFGAILAWVKGYFVAKKKFKEGMEESASRGVLNKFIEQATKK